MPAKKTWGETGTGRLTTEAEERQFLAILRPPSQSAVIRFLKWQRTGRCCEAPEMSGDNLLAWCMLARIEGVIKDYLIDMDDVREELPPSKVRENLIEAARHLQRSARCLHRSGRAGIQAAGECAEHIYGSRHFVITGGKADQPGYHSKWPCTPTSLATGDKLVSDVIQLARGLGVVVARRYSKLSEEDRKRGMQIYARRSMAANLWRDYCQVYSVPLSKRTDRRFNKLFAAVLTASDSDPPRDLRAIISAGRTMARTIWAR